MNLFNGIIELALLKLVSQISHERKRLVEIGTGILELFNITENRLSFFSSLFVNSFTS